MIFSHELHHLQRQDIDTKFFLVLITSLCWFNPLVWIAARKGAEDLELSCDEIVTANMTNEERKRYALLLLNNTSRQNGFTTCLSAAAGTLRYRMKNIVETRSKRTGYLAVSAMVFLCIMLFGITGITTTAGNFNDLILKNNNYVVDNLDLDLDNGSSLNCEDPDQETALSIIGQVQLQKLNDYGDTSYFSSDDKQCLYISLTSEKQNLYVNLHKDLVLVYDEDGDDTYYKVVSDVDWEALQNLMN